MVKLGGVHGDGVLDLPEQILVIDDIAKILVVGIQPVGTADGLKQAVILHGLVDVQIRTGRSIESGQQLVHDDQQLHAGGFLDETGPGLILVRLGFRHARLRLHVFQQFGVGVVDELFVGFQNDQSQRRDLLPDTPHDS